MLSDSEGRVDEERNEALSIDGMKGVYRLTLGTRSGEREGVSERESEG